jgi:hypothetical protein
MPTSRARDSIQRTKMTDPLLFTYGYLAGVEGERQRILKALRAKAATRTILETLAAPFYIEELEATIMEGQNE